MLKLLVLGFRYPLKAVNVMHTVALRTESTIAGSITHPMLSTADQVSIVIQIIGQDFLFFAIIDFKLYDFKSRSHKNSGD